MADHGQYRMVQVGHRNGKPHWRGTGFNPNPGGVTWIEDGCGWVPRILSWRWWPLLLAR